MRIENSDAIAFKLAAIIGAASSGGAAVVTADWALAVFGVPLATFAAAFAGALISLSVFPPTQRWYWGLVGGTVMGAYFTPLAGKLWPLLIGVELGTAFGIGLFGLMLISMAFEDGRAIARAYVRKRLGLDPGGPT